MIQKLITIAIFIVIWFWTQKLISKRMPKGKGIVDMIHVWTAPVNSYLQKHWKISQILLISSSFFIDAFTLIIISLSLFGPDFRPFWALMIVFILRQIFQATVALPAPASVIWKNPGIPSLFVTYGVANDFYFSGHTALAVLGAAEIIHLGHWTWSVLAVLIVVYEVIVVLLLRAHWTMDVITGIFVALFVYQFSFII